MKLAPIVFVLALSFVSCNSQEGPVTEAGPAESVAVPSTAVDEPAALPETAPPTPKEMLPKGLLLEPDLLTGGQPSLEQLDLIAAQGFRTVLNLRQLAEQGQLPMDEFEVRGIEFLQLPISGQNGINEQNARTFSDLLDDPSLRPLVVHCGSGNRIGALFALKAFHVDGLDAEEALEVGIRSGLTGLEPKVREYLGLPPVD